MADFGESRGYALSEERVYLILQSIVGREETKVVEQLANSDLLVFLWGNCGGDCPFSRDFQRLWICPRVSLSWQKGQVGEYSFPHS